MLGLAFSGGKDSLACWYLSKAEKPIVFWVNTGKAYPETLEIVEEVRREASEFVEVNSDQQSQNDLWGIPSDLVPINNTTLGMVFTGQKPVKVQSYLGCCYENISGPLAQAVKEKRITKLIRGQRLQESHKATSRNGDIVLGVEYLHPIETWTSEDVLNYLLERRGSLPDHYHIAHSSLDCYDCTAFVQESKDRVEWTRNKHPAFYSAYAKRMDALKSVLLPNLRLLENHA